MKKSKPKTPVSKLFASFNLISMDILIFDLPCIFYLRSSASDCLNMSVSFLIKLNRICSKRITITTDWNWNTYNWKTSEHVKRTSVLVSPNVPILQQSLLSLFFCCFELFCCLIYDVFVCFVVDIS